MNDLPHFKNIINLSFFFFKKKKKKTQYDIHFRCNLTWPPLRSKQAEAKVIIHLEAINIIDDYVTEPKRETWNFIKGTKGSLRNKWIRVLEK